jgi:ubiquinone/menaquinone biosynthesis C-methylase UbiE
MRRRHQQAIYKHLARFYNFQYPDKDYKREVAVVKDIIKRYKQSPGKDLLEVACGTGKHAEYLKNDFSVLATDINDGVLNVARKTVKGVRFKRADMRNLKLRKRFDVILCLFSSIGYVKTKENLKKTLKSFSRHLKPGGVLVIDPWRSKSEFRTGTHLSTYEAGDFKIAVLAKSQVRGNVSITDDHYLLSEKNGDIQYFVDRHELGLFDGRDMSEAMKEAGMRPLFLKRGRRPARLTGGQAEVDPFFRQIPGAGRSRLRQAETRVEVYAIKVTLLGTSPSVWRRILVPREITLRNLHRTLQTVMGWTNSHLHQFVCHRPRVSDTRSRVVNKIADENRTTLGELIRTVGAFTVGSNPVGMAFDGTSMWVANRGSTTVTKLRASDGSVLGNFTVPSGGWRGLRRH